MFPTVLFALRGIAAAVVMTVSFAQAATGPAAPQSPGQFDPCGDGDNQRNITNPATSGPNDRGACIDPGQSLFIDPGGGNFAGVGPCRSVANSNAGNLYVPLSTPAEYQSFRAGNQNGQPPPGVTEAVCCRPSQMATLCKGSSGGAQSRPIVGTTADNAGTTGYGVAGSIGTATATCTNQGTSYVETQTFVCGQIGFGVSADGQWDYLGDNSSCTASYTTHYGACSTTCGTGNQLETIYDACGNVVSSSYSGPSCTANSGCPAPCSPLVINWEQDSPGVYNGTVYGGSICQGALPSAQANTTYTAEAYSEGFAGQAQGCFVASCAGAGTGYMGTGWIIPTPADLDGVTLHGYPLGTCMIAGGSQPALPTYPNNICGQSVPPPSSPSQGSCSPASVANGTVAPYPDCSISCDDGYVQSGNRCVAAGEVGCVPHTYSCCGLTFEDCSGSGYACSACASTGPVCSDPADPSCCSGPGCSGGSSWGKAVCSNGTCECLGAVGTSVYNQPLGPGCCCQS